MPENEALNENTNAEPNENTNPDVDGGLIGGAALKVADFKGIIDAFN